MSNAADGWPGAWVDGAVNILRTFAQNGAPSRRAAGWKGRWWSTWGPCDLVPMGDKVVTGVPAWVNPFLDSAEIELTSRDTGRVCARQRLCQSRRARAACPDRKWPYSGNMDRWRPPGIGAELDFRAGATLWRESGQASKAAPSKMKGPK